MILVVLLWSSSVLVVTTFSSLIRALCGRPNWYACSHISSTICLTLVARKRAGVFDALNNQDHRSRAVNSYAPASRFSTAILRSSIASTRVSRGTITLSGEITIVEIESHGYV